MKRSYLVFALLAVLVLLVSACGTPAGTSGGPASVPTSSGPTSVPTTSPTYTPFPTNTPVAGPATINVGTDPKLGSFLVDGKGMTLYIYVNDTPGTSTCDGQCSYYWPPVLTTGAPVAGTGVDASKFGTFTRSDGSTQVTYNGLPLYAYSGDTNPGDTTGQNYQDLWNMVSPAGDKIK